MQLNKVNSRSPVAPPVTSVPDLLAPINVPPWGPPSSPSPSLLLQEDSISKGAPPSLTLDPPQMGVPPCESKNPRPDVSPWGVPCRPPQSPVLHLHLPSTFPPNLNSRLTWSALLQIIFYIQNHLHHQISLLQLLLPKEEQ